MIRLHRLVAKSVIIASMRVNYSGQHWWLPDQDMTGGNEDAHSPQGEKVGVTA
jgi:hypothetical protein